MSEIHISVLNDQRSRTGLIIPKKGKKKKKTSSMKEGVISRNTNNKTMTVKIG